MSKFCLPALLLSVALSGCVSAVLSKKVTEAPNRYYPSYILKRTDLLEKRDSTYSSSWRLEVGPPAATLAIGVLEPGDYQFSYRIEERPQVSGYVQPVGIHNWKKPLQTRPAKGTILLLHGIMHTREMMWHWALYLAEAGYRTVLVDFRGHGRSTGDVIGFGAFETRDLSTLIDDLQKRGLAEARVGVFGISYGGSVGIQLAGKDPRVATVVAVAAFSDPKQAVIEFAREVPRIRSLTSGWSEADFISTIDRSARRAGFSWDSIDVPGALKKSGVPVLLFHGTKDTMISPKHSEVLHRHAATGSELHLVPGDDHIWISKRLDPMGPQVRQWFDTRLAESAKGSP